MLPLNYKSPVSSIPFFERFRFKEVRATQCEIPFPNYCSSLSTDLFSERFIFKEVRATQFEIPLPKNSSPYLSI